MNMQAEIIALGNGVDGFAVGDKISVLPPAPAGIVAGCAGGNHILCRSAESVMRGFAEFARVPTSVA
jgi:threonine dehydrogenase-like Zn-dependent dehydrogenase